jgi:CRP-like cAMP-binding protein
MDPEIAKAEFFRVLTPAQWARVEPHLRTRRFSRGELLFLEEEPADALWVLREGEVRLTKLSADGTVTTLEMVGPGQFFGAVSTLDEASYPVTAEAVTDGVGCQLRASVMLALIDESPAVGHELLRVVSARLRHARERARSFAHDRAPERLAGALLRVAHGGEAHVTRRSLAEAAGTTVETAIRVLRRFEREGWIEGRVGCIRVRDEGALRRFAGEGAE